MRTRLRGLEIAGIQMGIEVPESYAWEWPESAVSEFICLPREPEVHIGLRVADFSSADLGGECYGLGAWTFEVASRGDDWLLGLSRRGVREQIAVFDRHFCNGEVLITQEAAAQRRFPLRTPLDEWIVLHRTVARGGLCLNGTATHSGGRARIGVGCESPRLSAPNRWSSHRMALLGRNTVLIREEGGQLRNFGTPWSDAADRTLGHATPVSELVVTEIAERPFRECLDPDEAAEVLLANAVVPLVDDMLLDLTLTNAKRIAQRTPVVRLGDFDSTPPPIGWQDANFQNAFAPPGSSQ